MDVRLKEKLSLYKGECSPFLDHRIRLAHLLDEDHCVTLMDNIYSTYGKWIVKTATESLYEYLPREPGLYMFVWAPRLDLKKEACKDSALYNLVLYIGQAGAGGTSGNLKDRYKDGYSSFITGDPKSLWDDRTTQTRCREDLLRKYLTIRPLEYWYIVVDDTDNLSFYEKRLINVLSPPLNTTGQLSIGKTIPAF